MFLGTAKPLVDQPLPVWEHGYRCHGYWLDTQRMGHVSLTPKGFPVEYSWALDDLSAKPTKPTDPPAHGTTRELRAAKRAVERAFRHYYSWRFPRTRGW